MFVYNREDLRRPIKIWLGGREDIDENCLEQAEHLAQLPFIHKWVALMPDTHAGKGMPSYCHKGSYYSKCSGRGYRLRHELC